MKSVNFEIYKGTERIGILPGKFVNKTEVHEKFILLGNDYIIEPGYTIYADKDEKFYVTDVHVHRSCKSNNNLEIYYETEAERIRHIKQIKHDWKIALFNTLGGALAGLITSIIFWLITE